MKALLTISAVLLVPACAFAQSAPGPKACEELKSEITTKLDAKGVKGYSLEIVEKDKEVTDAKVVGTCEGGTKKIVYSKKANTAAAATKEPTKP